MPRLELAFLGPFQATSDGRPLTEFESSKVRALLAYLAVESDRPHARESLAGLLWPGYADRSALNNLRSALANLRRAIGDHEAEPPFLLISREAIQFNSAADCLLDAATLRGAAQKTPDELAQAVESYHGPFLDGFSLDDCPAFEEWVLARRAAFQREALAALEHLAAGAEAGGEMESALAYARRALALEPWDEQAHRQVMRALTLSGRRDQALAQYETCRRLLRDELDVEPSAETQALAERIRDESLGPLAPVVPAQQPPAPGAPPFKGLNFFDEADAALFFGRAALVAQLAAQVRAFLAPDGDGARVLAVIGASGSGKSSIVRAGLLPALRPAFGEAVFVLTPTARPLEALALALTGHAQGVGETAVLLDDLARDPRALHLAAGRLARRHALPHILLVIDQFEELFSLCRDEDDRQAFIAALLYAVETPGPTCLILALRADFYAQCAPYPALRSALCRCQQYIGAMSPAELRLAIEEPAHGGGWTLEPGLVDLYLGEVGDAPGALPLLSHALLETWRRRRGRAMTLAGYQEAGGVSGAIARTAESTYALLPPPQQAVARSIFLRLTEFGGDVAGEAAPERFTRRRVALGELLDESHDAAQVLTRLADARLVTTARETAEITHEALLREWTRLRDWLEEDLAGLRLHRRLTEAAQEWARLDQDAGLLYRGALLAASCEYAAQHAADLNQQERDFLEVSRAAEQAQQDAAEAARQRELAAAQALAEEQRLRAEAETETAGKLRRRALLLGLAVSALVLLLGAALWLSRVANRNARATEEQARLATSRELAAAAVNALQLDPERGVLLALQALETADTLEARNALHQALPELHNVHTIAANVPGGTPGVAYSPDGTLMASIGFYDGAVNIWDAATGDLVHNLVVDAGALGVDVAISPDGRLLAASFLDHTRVWEMAGGELRWRLSEGDLGSGSQGRLAFSPDSSRLAVINSLGQPRVWNMTDGRLLLTLAVAEGSSDGIAYSPDGQLLAAGSSSGLITLWDAATGAEVDTLEHGGWVHGLAFSPRGEQLAVAGEDGRLVVFNLAGGSTALSLPTRSGLYDVAYMPDGERLVSAHQEGTTMIWDAADGRPLLTLAGHLSTVISIAASPDNIHLVTGGYDSTVRVWDTRPGRELATVVGAQAPAPVYGLALSPDGARLASAGADGSATVWDVAAGVPVLSPFAAAGSAGWNSVLFSPDGRRLAMGGSDGTVVAGSAQTGEIEHTLVGHKELVWGLAFSPDGTRLATTSWDATARVWDLETGEEITTLLGHLDMIFGVAFSSDGTRVYTAGEQYVREWDAATGEPLRIFTSAEGLDTYGLAVSPDGQRLAVGLQDGTVLLWDIASGEQVGQLSGHGGLVIQVVFSADGRKLATASFDKFARYWDLTSGQELATLYGNGSNVFGVALSPDGRALYTAGGDGTLRAYTLDTAELTALARARLTRDLTTEECRRYLHMDACPAPPPGAAP